MTFYLLETSDKQILKISPEALKMSEVLKATLNFYEQMGDSNENRTLKLLEVDSRTATKIVEYCEKFHEKKAVQSYLDLPKEELAFFTMEFGDLVQFANAVNYLAIDKALKHVCKYINYTYVRYKTTEEIRRTFFQ